VKTVLQVQGLGFRYPQRPVFSGLDVSIGAGVTLVRGGDGSGKSTLLRLLAGDLPAHTGQLRLHGASLQESPQVYRQQVFWADMRTQEHDQLSALDYFAQCRQHYPNFLPLASAQLDRLFSGLSLPEHLEKPLYMLSTGSKRKVWLAAAFAAGAALTLLDDPFAALDKASITFVLHRLSEAASDPSQAWVVAHYDNLEHVPVAQVIDLDDVH